LHSRPCGCWMHMNMSSSPARFGALALGEGAQHVLASARWYCSGF
jgi:hypothetical protein